MKAETYILIFLIILVHFIGSCVMIIIHHKNGTYESASKNEYGYGDRYCTPCEILFYDLFLWEVEVIFEIIFKIEDLINEYFKKKYR